MKLGALFSGGKDSTYAMFKASKEHNIVCLITIKSLNPESYMFHTPNIDLVNLQAKAIGLPLIEVATRGEKEKELKDLENALRKAKQEFDIEGVVTGALYSNYQKERVEKVAEKVGLKVLSPLWHMDQEKYMREVIEAGFKFILTQIAAEGLNKSWLGKVITSKDVDKLVELNKTVRINIAFEGGEAETMTIDGPIFKSKIVIKNAEIIMENECTGLYKITEAELE